MHFCGCTGFLALNLLLTSAADPHHTRYTGPFYEQNTGTHNAATLREANHRTEKRHPTVRCSDGGNLAKQQQQQQSRHPYTVSHTQPRAYHDETCESERPKRRERERDKASTALSALHTLAKAGEREGEYSSTPPHTPLLLLLLLAVVPCV